VYIKKIFIFTLITALSGCVSKALIEKDNQESAFIKILTPKIRYADMGFIYRGDSFLKVEIYAMGQPIVKFDINEVNICMSTLECMEKGEFNRDMLVKSYPPTLLENIFRGKPIFDGKNLKGDGDSFVQNITDSRDYNIIYEVTDGNRKFYDKINKIKIEVKSI